MIVLPKKILIVGNSTPLLMMPERKRREDGTYGEQLERILADRGVLAQVTNESRLFELLHEGSRRFRDDMPGFFPDVVIFHYGMLELQPNVAPTAIVRHLTRIERGNKGIRGLWMRRGTKLVWPHVRRYQRWASGKVGMRTWRLPPIRFAAELDHVIEVARRSKALVLVADVHRPNERLEHFMPGVAQRWEVIQETIRTVVERKDDPMVRLVEASKVVEDDPTVTTDGLHLTAGAHRQVAEMFATEILDWAGVQEG